MADVQALLEPVTVALDRLPVGRQATVRALAPPPDADRLERAQQLTDLGFTPGEAVTVVARAWPGGDPLVVRVGHSRFALRAAEAACVQVRPLAAEPAAGGAGGAR